MINRNRKSVKIINIISDSVIIVLSYIVSMLTRYVLLKGTVTVNPFQQEIVLSIIALSIALAVAYQAYNSNYFNMIIITGCGTFAVMAVLFIFKVTDFSRWSLIIFFLLTSALVVSKHAMGHFLVSHNAALGNGERVIALVGKGKVAEQYVDDIKQTFPNYSIVEFNYSTEVDEIVIAVEPEEATIVKDVIAFADKEGIAVSLIPFFSDYIPQHPEIETFGKSKLINLRATPLDNIGGAFIKRAGDIVISLLMIIVLSPLLLFTAIGVRLSSSGPILFKQQRVGKDKKVFSMLKFRSMRVNSEETTAWSTQEDPRRTKFGSFIRKYSIDELPQLFNVLIGDMSLVGPRPELPFFVEQFKETIPLYLVRQQVRPGITGWAQINGLRGDTSIKRRVEFDIWYIENWSVGLDISILFNTIFKGKFKNEEKNSR